MRPDNWRDLCEDETMEFDIHCKMSKAWANELLSMLKHMEDMGDTGRSGFIAFYADGDGDFRPKFSTDYKFTKKDIASWNNSKALEEVFHSFEGFYDAG